MIAYTVKYSNKIFKCINQVLFINSFIHNDNRFNSGNVFDKCFLIIM